MTRASRLIDEFDEEHAWSQHLDHRADLARVETVRRVILAERNGVQVADAGQPRLLGQKMTRVVIALCLEAGVEGVAEAVAEHVDGEDGQHDGAAGEDRHPPGAAQEVAAVGEHGAPFRRRRLRAKP